MTSKPCTLYILPKGLNAIHRPYYTHPTFLQSLTINSSTRLANFQAHQRKAASPVFSWKSLSSCHGVYGQSEMIGPSMTLTPWNCRRKSMSEFSLLLHRAKPSLIPCYDSMVTGAVISSFFVLLYLNLLS